MASSFRLLLLGLVIGILSSFYPRLPAYLPRSVSRWLPLLPPSELGPGSESWTKYAQYQASVPVASNHDPYDHTGSPAEPKLRQIANPKAREAQERAKAKAIKEIEDRAQAAGKENHIGPELPLYFFDETASPEWESMLKQIKDLDLENVVTIEASPLIDEQAIVLSGDRDLADKVADSLDRFPTRYTEQSLSSFPSLFSHTRHASIALPELAHWNSQHWFAIGSMLHQLRHKGTVFVALGTARPLASREPSPAFERTLAEVLHHYTAHPREQSLAALVSGSTGEKPAKAIRRHLTPLYVAVALAEQSEGERTSGGWRFGHLV